MSVGSGGWREGDAVAGRFELSDVVVDALGGVSSLVVEVVAEVSVGLAGDGHVPCRDQDGVSDGDGCFVGSASAGDAAVAGREEGAFGS